MLLPALAPGEQGYASMELPSNFFDADVLEMTAYNPDGSEMCTRTWSVGYARDYWKRHGEASSVSSPAVCRKQGNSVTLSAGGVEVTFDKTTGYITRVLSGKQSVSFSNGPVPVGMVASVKSSQTRMDGDTAVFAVKYDGNIDSIVWRMSPEGLLDMNLLMLNRSRLGGGLDDAASYDNITNLGITFSYPESCVTGMRWLGGGPYRVWKNRLRGANMGVWEKAYNNTITGESFENLIYPEFKGYHSNLYWATIQNKEQDFTVYSMSDGVYLRMLTPEEPKNRQGSTLTMPAFPAGDISFLLETLNYEKGLPMFDKEGTPIIDDPIVAENIQFIQKLYDEYKVNDRNFDTAANTFATGESAMIYNWGWLTYSLKSTAPDKNIGYFQTPSFVEGEVCPAYGRNGGDSSLAVSATLKDEAKIEAAFDFLTYLLANDDAVYEFDELLSMYPRKISLRENQEKIDGNVVFKELKNYVDRTVWPGPVPGSYADNNYITYVVDPIFKENADIASTLTSAQKVCSDALAEEGNWFFSERDYQYASEFIK